MSRASPSVEHQQGDGCSCQDIQPGSLEEPLCGCAAACAAAAGGGCCKEGSMWQCLWGLHHAACAVSEVCSMQLIHKSGHRR
jgi:hypothetical protein